MNSESDAGRRDQYPLSMFLRWSLVQAIEYGDPEAIVAALEEQAQTEVTQEVSNRLLVRTFLVSQKGKLVTLDSALSRPQTIVELSELIRSYIEGLNTEFTDMFVSDNTENKYAKLSGDTLFREVLSAPGESSLEVARQMLAIDTKSLLLSPEGMFGVIEYIRDTVSKALENVIHDTLGGSDDRTQADMRQVIAQQIFRLDRLIERNLPRV